MWRPFPRPEAQPAGAAILPSLAGCNLFAHFHFERDCEGEGSWKSIRLEDFKSCRYQACKKNHCQSYKSSGLHSVRFQRSWLHGAILFSVYAIDLKTRAAV